MAYSRSYIRLSLKILSGLLLIAFAGAPLSSREKNQGNENEAAASSSFKARVNAVVVRVEAADAAGRPVTDLTADDLRIYDDGKPQIIQTFARETAGPTESETGGDRDVLSKSRSDSKEKTEQSSRMISIVIDDLTMESVKDFPRIVDAAKEFVKNHLADTDQVALLSGSRKVQFGFSNDRQKLLNELDSLPHMLNINLPFRFCKYMTDLEAWNISTNSNRYSLFYQQLNTLCNTTNEFAEGRNEELLWHFAIQTKDFLEFRTGSLLQTILQHLRVLRHFRGTRVLVIFSDGFVAKAGSKVAYKMQDVVNTALSADIALHTVSTRGVTAYDDMRDGMDIMEGDIVAQVMIPMREHDKQAKHAALAQMAEETGGMFFQGNDLFGPLKTISEKRSIYYVLTYGMPAHPANGLRHSVRLEALRPGLKLSYRKGYYVPKEEMVVETSRREDIMAALHAPGDMNEIPISIAYDYFWNEDALYTVSCMTHVLTKDLGFAREEDRNVNQVSLVLAAYDEAGQFINGLEKIIDFRLLESSYAGLQNRGLTSRVEMKLPAGRYTLRAVVREGNQGKMGSAVKSIEIP